MWTDAAATRADAALDAGTRPGTRPSPADEDDLGLFGPGSVTWRVHSEPILGLAGLRALYLQALHPRAIAGVVQNSGYKSDPWGRLMRTVDYVAAVIYGTTAEAEQAGRRVRAVHARLTAVDPDTGERFRVDEPDLLRWVHVTEVESFLTTARRAGVRLSPAESDAYYAEQRRAARLVGLSADEVPGSVAEVDEFYREIRPQLRITTPAADSALFLTHPPMPWRLGLTPVRLAWYGIAATAVGLLPPWARRLYGLPGLATTDLTVSASVRTLRLALAVLPHRFYEGPRYQAAIARAARLAATAPGTA
ncbi:MAG TPA: oxygenase MpaB family protein [Micromonosporaceae bacterium]|nr:oxygenase MpaB family protein [Micromonosporaceae bacterium]